MSSGSWGSNVVKGMKKIVYSLVWLLAAVAVALPVALLFGVEASQNTEKINRCEKAGGIFYDGNWGADNCVFPPNGQGVTRGRENK